jgi:acyl-CoA thioester hydrolase
VLASELELDVAFHDTDLMQVVWHGHYLKYLENARWRLMDDLGFGYSAMVASGYSWPIVDLHVRYVRVARFGDRLRVRASLVEWESRLAVHYLVTDAATGDRIARARSVQVAVDGRTGDLQFLLPAGLVDRVRARLGGTDQPARNGTQP